MARTCRVYGAVLIGFLLNACTCRPAPPDTGILQQQVDGYGILYGLMKDESKVGQIFVIKHAPDSVGDLVRQVGDTCKAAQAKLQSFSVSDPALNLGDTNLPEIEQRSRDITASLTARELLFSDGKKFQLHLLFTQAQAMGYAVALCDALRDHERNPQRKEFLRTLSAECSGLHDRLMAMLTVNS